MTLRRLQAGESVADDDFDTVYPGWVRDLSRVHWTPVEVAKFASRLLADEPGRRVLDIGSGVGKFCLIGACCSQGYFTGIEQREKFVDVARTIANQYNLGDRLEFRQTNVLDVDFHEFESFYFFNAFAEQAYAGCRIDDEADISLRRYRDYQTYLVERFTEMPIGTRVVTYHGGVRMPKTYRLAGTYCCDFLRLWIQAPLARRSASYKRW